MKTFLAGLGTGCAIGVLVAPKPGREARQDLRKKAGELRTMATEQAAKLKEAVGDPQQLLGKVKEQAKPYVDQAQEMIGNAAEQLKETAKSVAAKAGMGPLLILNTAPEEELMKIYGIGPVLADKIIKGRPYTSEHEVVDRGIISENILKELTRSLKSA
jgi:gas vesicle protein